MARMIFYVRADIADFRPVAVSFLRSSILKGDAHAILRAGGTWQVRCSDI